MGGAVGHHCLVTQSRYFDYGAIADAPSGCAVLRVNKAEGAAEPVEAGELEVVKAVGSSVTRSQTLELHLPAGAYLIIPTSSGSVGSAAKEGGAAGGVSAIEVGGGGELCVPARRLLHQATRPCGESRPACE